MTAPAATMSTVPTSLAPYIKIRIPSFDDDTATTTSYRKIATSRILREPITAPNDSPQAQSPQPSLEMLSNVVTILVQEQLVSRRNSNCNTMDAVRLAGLQYVDDDGDGIDLMTDDDLQEALRMTFRPHPPSSLKVQALLKRTAPPRQQQLSVSLYGRERACILRVDPAELGHSTVSNNNGTASLSYWKLLQRAQSQLGGNDSAHPDDDDPYPAVLYRLQRTTTTTTTTRRILIANDEDLSWQLERRSTTDSMLVSFELVLNVYVYIADDDTASHHSTTAPLSLHRLPLTRILTTEGQLSLAKLMQYWQQRHPLEPLLNFVYLQENEPGSNTVAAENGTATPNNADTTTKKKNHNNHNNHNPNSTPRTIRAHTRKRVVSTTDELRQAYAHHGASSLHPQRHAFLLHPRYQSTQVTLPPDQAIVCGSCELSTIITTSSTTMASMTTSQDGGNSSTMNHHSSTNQTVLLNAPDSMAGWDVSRLVPGRYKAKARYFRLQSSGAVSLYTGKVVMKETSVPSQQHNEETSEKPDAPKEPASTMSLLTTATTTTPTNHTAAFSKQVTAAYRAQLDEWRLNGTGADASVADDYEYVGLGEISVEGAVGETFCVASQPPASAWFGSDAAVAVGQVSLIYVGI